MTDTLFGVPIRATEMMQFVWMLGWVPLTALLYWLLKRLFGVVVATGDRQWPNQEWRWGATVFVVAMLLWPWWGVVTLSIEADRLCREHSGLHVYKILEVDGVRTTLGIEWAAARGFKYVEDGNPDYPNSMYRETLVDGKPVREKITEFTTRNEFATDHIQFSKRVGANRFLIRDVVTNETLADAVTVGGDYSDFDYRFMLGLGSGGWDCGSKFKPNDDGTWSENDVVTAALKPLRHSAEIKR